MCLYRAPQKAPGILFSNGLKQEKKQDKKPVCPCVCVCATREAEMREKKTKQTKSPERYYETASRSKKRKNEQQRNQERGEGALVKYILIFKKKKTTLHYVGDTE